MNTNQSLLSLGALLLLSVTVLRVNNNILSTDTVLYDAKFGLIANSLATSMIEKASKKFFDANTTEGPVLDPSGLTSAGSLGPGWWEDPPDSCNDFDDFNNLSLQDTFYGSVVFFTDCKVNYINPTNPDGKASSQTWHKKLTVSVYWRQVGDPGGTPTDTINHSTIYSYWYFE